MMKATTIDDHQADRAGNKSIPPDHAAPGKRRGGDEQEGESAVTRAAPADAELPAVRAVRTVCSITGQAQPRW